MVSFEKACEKAIPFVLLSSTFFIVVSLAMAFLLDGYGGDLLGVSLEVDAGSIFFLFFVYCMSVILFFLFFKSSFFVSKKTAFIPKINQWKNPQPVHFLAFSIIVFSFFVVTLTSTGTISRGGEGVRSIELIFAFIQPFYFCIIYFYVFSASGARVYFLNFVLFCFLCIMTGFVGYAFFLIPLVLKVLMSYVGRLKFFLLFVTGIFLMPFAHFYKYVFKYSLGLSDIYSIISIDLYFAFFRSIVDRFNYLPNMLFINDNIHQIRGFVDQVSYQPFYQGYLGSLLYKIFYSSSVSNLQGELNYMMHGLRSSNVTFPLPSYYFFDPAFFIVVSLYSFFLMFILGVLLTRFYVSEKVMKYPFFVTTFFFLLQGWFWPFFNFIQAGVVFYICVSLCRISAYSLVSPCLSTKRHTRGVERT